MKKQVLALCAMLSVLGVMAGKEEGSSRCMIMMPTACVSSNGRSSMPGVRMIPWGARKKQGGTTRGPSNEKRKVTVVEIDTSEKKQTAARAALKGFQQTEKGDPIFHSGGCLSLRVNDKNESQ